MLTKDQKLRRAFNMLFPATQESFASIPEVNWQQPDWTITRTAKHLVIRHGGNEMSIPLADVPRVLAQLYRLAPP
jgi:hypothetical protein